jgi:hypothetical protein
MNERKIPMRKQAKTTNKEQHRTSRHRTSGEALLELAAWAEKQDFDLPVDLSSNHDTHLWENQEAGK